MNWKRIILLVVSLSVLGFVVGGAAWFLLLKYAQKYTAQTYIRVPPPVEKDPMTIGPALVSQDIQYGHRVSMANLIKRQSTLLELLDKTEVQETKWFEHFGKTKAIKLLKAFKDLKKNFGAYAHRDAEFVVLSMACGDAKEAALIVNQMVDLFLSSQRDTKRGEVSAKLTELENRKYSVQRELNAAEQALADVRRASGFTDLEEHNYPHSITVRLNHLQFENDNCVLEVRQVQTNIENLQKRVEESVSEQVKDELEANLKDVQSELIMLQGKLEELEKMRNEAKAQKRELDLARVQYEQRRRIRDERVRMLEAIKAQIEKLRIMLDDPETPKVQFVGYAPVPLEAGSPK